MKIYSLYAAHVPPEILIKELCSLSNWQFQLENLLRPKTGNFEANLFEKIVYQV